MKNLLDTFDHARYPLLIHCMGGADRTGLASTIYMNLYRHEPLDQAETEELSLRYGHIKGGKAKAMDQFFDLYRQTGKGMDLRTWILKKYPTVYHEVTHE